MNEAWPTTIDEAVAVQQRLRGQVVARDDFGAIATVAGVDVGFEDEGQTARAAVVVLDYPSLAPRDYALARLPVAFPYVPGFLSFRETPVILRALAQLHHPPSVLLVDGQGLAHPRRFGIACHLGVLANLPAIGVAKSLLTGRFEPIPDERGAWQPLVDKGEVVGAALRTRAGTKPLFISAGHRIGLPSAIALVMACTTRYRLPETTRAAHNLASNGVAPLLPPHAPPEPLAATQERLL
ncbi:MAG: deoxyribonuclease V [Chloroflexales bacterium]|nr:deoxyribonuclease V [Chloroflexales bacterium]